jgi:hypothetical protein
MKESEEREIKERDKGKGTRVKRKICRVRRITVKGRE